MERESRSREELLERIHGADGQLEDWLVERGRADTGGRQAVTDAIGIAAKDLAPDDEPSAGAADTWRALVGAADRLWGSGVFPLGRLAFVRDDLLAALVAESQDQQPKTDAGEHRTVGEPGRVLAALAVSRQLREALGELLREPVLPTYDAIYLYEPPGSHVRTHLDAGNYELVFHLVVEHALPDDGSDGSALVVHLPGESRAKRFRLRPGEAVALLGRGTIHSWEPLRTGERRTLTAVGFERAA